MVYVQEINYPSTNIRHRHNTCTILGTRSHTNIRVNYEYNPKIQNKKHSRPEKRENPKQGKDTRLNLFEKVAKFPTPMHVHKL